MTQDLARLNGLIATVKGCETSLVQSRNVMERNCSLAICKARYTTGVLSASERFAAATFDEYNKFVKQIRVNNAKDHWMSTGRPGKVVTCPVELAAMAQERQFVVNQYERELNARLNACQELLDKMHAVSNYNGGQELHGQDASPRKVSMPIPALVTAPVTAPVTQGAAGRTAPRTRAIAGPFSRAAAPQAVMYQGLINSQTPLHGSIGASFQSQPLPNRQVWHQPMRYQVPVQGVAHSGLQHVDAPYGQQIASSQSQPLCHQAPSQPEVQQAYTTGIDEEFWGGLIDLGAEPSTPAAQNVDVQSTTQQRTPGGSAQNAMVIDDDNDDSESELSDSDVEMVDVVKKQSPQQQQQQLLPSPPDSMRQRRHKTPAMNGPPDPRANPKGNDAVAMREMRYKPRAWMVQEKARQEREAEIAAADPVNIKAAADAKAAKLVAMKAAKAARVQARKQQALDKAADLMASRHSPVAKSAYGSKGRRTGGSSYSASASTGSSDVEACLQRELVTDLDEGSTAEDKQPAPAPAAVRVPAVPNSHRTKSGLVLPGQRPAAPTTPSAPTFHRTKSGLVLPGQKPAAALAAATVEMEVEEGMDGLFEEEEDDSVDDLFEE